MATTNSGNVLEKPELDQLEKGAKLEVEDAIAPTEEEKAAYIRKLDWHIMPVIFLIYMLSVLDRSNLGNAHVAGLDEGIGLVGNQYNMLGTVFYIGCKSLSAFLFRLALFCFTLLGSLWSL